MLKQCTVAVTVATICFWVQPCSAFEIPLLNKTEANTSARTKRKRLLLLLDPHDRTPFWQVTV